MLVQKITNNRAEMFMSILGRFTSGKRLNLVTKGSFRKRCILTGLRYNESFEWHQKPWKSHSKRSPGKYFKNYINKKMREKTKRTLRRPELRRKLFKNQQPEHNFEYGPKAIQPDMSSDDIEKEIQDLIARLQVRTLY